MEKREKCKEIKKKKKTLLGECAASSDDEASEMASNGMATRASRRRQLNELGTFDTERTRSLSFIVRLRKIL